MRSELLYICVILLGNILLGQNGVDYVLINLDQIERLKNTHQKKIEAISSGDSLAMAFAIKNANIELTNKYYEIGDKLQVATFRASTSINRASNILTNYASARYYSFTFFLYESNCSESQLSSLKDNLLNLIKAKEYANKSKSEYNELVGVFYELKDKLKKLQTDKDRIESRIENNVDTIGLSRKLQLVKFEIDTVEYKLVPYDYQMDQLSIFRVKNSSIDELRQKIENLKYLIVQPYVECFEGISSRDSEELFEQGEDSSKKTREIIRRLLAQHTVSTISNGTINKENIASYREFYRYDSEVELRLLLNVGNSFRFKDIIDTLDLEEKYRDIYFIMLKEYNRDMLSLSEEELINLKEKDLIYLTSFNLIWLPNFKSMKIKSLETPNRFHGEIEIWSLKKAFDEGMLTIDYLEIKN